VGRDVFLTSHSLDGASNTSDDDDVVAADHDENDDVGEYDDENDDEYEAGASAKRPKAPLTGSGMASIFCPNISSKMAPSTLSSSCTGWAEASDGSMTPASRIKPSSVGDMGELGRCIPEKALT
jgi:hypothetical protein